MNSVIVAAVYTFCAHYHEGQGSRLYRLLCRAERAWIRHAGIPPRLEYWEYLIESVPNSPVAKMYYQLVKKYA